MLCIGVIGGCASSGNAADRDKLQALRKSPLATAALAPTELARESIPVGATAENDPSITIDVALPPGTTAESAATTAAARLRNLGVSFRSADCSVDGFVGLQGVVVTAGGKTSWRTAVLLSAEARPSMPGVGRVKPPFLQLGLTIAREGGGSVNVDSQAPRGCLPSLVAAAGLS